MNDREHLALSIENALREADGLTGLFGNYTRQINALLPLFDSYAHGLAERQRECALENWRTGELENWRTGELENWRTGDAVHRLSRPLPL